MDLEKLFQELKAAGKLSEFLAVAGNATGLYNCSTEPVLVEGPYGNIYRRQMVITEAGQAFEGHKHNYDHVTYLLRGKVVRAVWDGDADGKPIGPVQEEVFQAPCWMLIRKGKFHKFTALTSDVIAECVFAVRNAATGEYSESWDGSRFPYV